jgi:hypothetical protein
MARTTNETVELPPYVEPTAPNPAIIPIFAGEYVVTDDRDGSHMGAAMWAESQDEAIAYIKNIYISQKLWLTLHWRPFNNTARSDTQIITGV